MRVPVLRVQVRVLVSVQLGVLANTFAVRFLRTLYTQIGSESAAGHQVMLPEDRTVCCGVMFPVRRTFCLLVTFDLIMTFIVWVSYMRVSFC